MINNESQKKSELPNIRVLTAHFKSLFRYRYWIALFAFVGLVCGALYAWIKPPEYPAKLSFILEEGKAPSGLSAIAGQFGIDIPTSSSTTLLAGDNIIGLLKSRRFVRTSLLTPYDSTKPSFSLADKYAEAYKLRQAWSKSDKIKQDIYFAAGKGSENFTPLQDSLLQIIENKLIKILNVSRVDRKMSLFEVETEVRDARLGKLFVERLVSNVIDFYIESKTVRTRTNIERLQRRTDSIGNLLDGQTYRAATILSTSLDINPAHQTAGVSSEISNRSKLMLGTIYAEVVKNLEIQKATLTQETPLIQIIDRPLLPVKAEKTSKIKYGIGGAFLFTLMGISFFYLIILYAQRKSKR